MFDKVAVISDVHGNRWALEAVLEDVARRGIQDIVNLGDCLYGPLDPAGTAQILVELDAPTVRGNEDRILLEPPSSEAERSPSFHFTFTRLSPEHLQWLRTLEMTFTTREGFFMCHGSPERDDEYLLERISAAGVALRESGELAKKLPSPEQQVVLCGHSHVPHTVTLPDGRLIVNPGSVGLPAYGDDLPYPHVMEAGTPHARYAVVSRNEAGWWVEDIAVPYDWQTAAETALKHSRPDWAEWLRTGRACN